MKFGTISIESGVIIIPIVVGDKTLGSYQINVTESTMTQNQWLDQLRDKRWFTPDLERNVRQAYNHIQQQMLNNHLSCTNYETTSRHP